MLSQKLKNNTDTIYFSAKISWKTHLVIGSE